MYIQIKKGEFNMTQEQQEFYEQLIKRKYYNKSQKQLIQDVIELGLSEQEVEDFIVSWSSKEIIIPKGIEILKESTFSDCTNLERITLQSTLKEIEKNAFRYCTSLKEIIIPEGVEKIGEYTFSDCTNLEKVTFPSTIKEIGKSAFHKCTSLKEITIPEGVEKLEEYSFR